MIQEEVLADYDLHQIKYHKPTAVQFKFTLVGLICLSMSRRIMNEIKNLSNNIGILILYQDTDSIHIPRKDIPRLVTEFEKVYDRPLIGKEME